MLLITSIIASIFALFFIKLSFNVIKLRRKNQVSLGTGGHADLEAAIRAHANFAEYAPLGLILIACLEANHAPHWLVAALGTLLIIARVIHSQAFSEATHNFKKRVLGMRLTFGTLVALIVCNLGWTVYQWI